VQGIVGEDTVSCCYGETCCSSGRKDVQSQSEAGDDAVEELSDSPVAPLQELNSDHGGKTGTSVNDKGAELPAFLIQCTAGARPGPASPAPTRFTEGRSAHPSRIGTPNYKSGALLRGRANTLPEDTKTVSVASNSTDEIVTVASKKTYKTSGDALSNGVSVESVHAASSTTSSNRTWGPSAFSAFNFGLVSFNAGSIASNASIVEAESTALRSSHSASALQSGDVTAGSAYSSREANETLMENARTNSGLNVKAEVQPPNVKKAKSSTWGSRALALVSGSKSALVKSSTKLVAPGALLPEPAASESIASSEKLSSNLSAVAVNPPAKSRLRSAALSKKN
jgi:hypothetical protein